MEETKSNEKDRRRSWITSLTVHAVLLLLAIIPLMQYEIPPPGQQGVLVSFGAPDMGQGDDRPDTQQEEEVEPEPPSESDTEEEVVDEPEVEETQPEETPPPQPETTKEVVTKEEPDLVAIQKKKQEEEEK